MHKTIPAWIGLAALGLMSGLAGAVLWQTLIGNGCPLAAERGLSRTPASTNKPTLSGTAENLPKKNNKTAKYKQMDISGDDIQLTYPLSEDKIGGTINITGIAKGKWYFEGEFPVSLVDAGGKVLAETSAIAKTEWMKEGYVPFLATMKYPVSHQQTAKIILKRNNPSDLPENDASYEIPVILAPNKTSTLLYFSSRYLERYNSICDNVFPVARGSSETMALGYLTLEKLLKGPNEAEKQLGYYSFIPQNIVIQKYDDSEKTARVDLSKNFLGFEVDGHCPRAIVQMQVRETLKQFSGIEEADITVDGKAIDPLSH